MKKLRHIVLLLILFFPIYAFALNGSFDINKTSMNIEVDKSDSFTVTAKNATGKVTFSSNNIEICTVNQSSIWLDKDSVKVTVKAISVGTCKISVNINGGSYDETPIIETKTVNVKVNAPKSGINILEDLKINGSTITGFSSEIESYTLKEIDASSINISATALDSNAKISGTGKISLQYGKNTINIVVTAENGNKKTYVIVINRIDNRSSNNYLKSLSVSNGTINFDKETSSYTVKLEHDINEIVITATSEDSKATIAGLGAKQLIDYTNEFEIIVTAENETTRKYVVKAIRKDQDGNYGKLSEDNTVKSINVKGYDLNFKTDTKKYNLVVEKDVDKLDIEVIANDSSANITILNNQDLKIGLNVITIKVTAENGNINEYIINVYKDGELTTTCPEEKDQSLLWKVIAIIEFILIIILLIVRRKPKEEIVNPNNQADIIDMNNQNNISDVSNLNSSNNIDIIDDSNINSQNSVNDYDFNHSNDINTFDQSNINNPNNRNISNF